MQTKSFMIIILGVLLLQPLMVGVSTPFSYVTQHNAETSNVLAQEAGARLDPDDYTNHVPIIIDGTNDFVSQGWPGSGTVADPYIIAGLNITYDLDIFLISIINTNASFVIRDCVLNQLSVDWAVRFVNTTAAMMEYTTIDSAGSGIFCNNANDTMIDHSLIECVYQYPISLEYSMNCQLTNNEVEGQDIVINGDHSHNLVSANNLYRGVPGDEGLWMEYCNDSSFSFDVINNAARLSFDDCYRISFSDVSLSGGGGLDISVGDGLEVYRCNFTSNNWRGISAINVPNVIIDDVYIQAHNQAGIYLQNGDNVSISEAVIEQVAGDGIYIDNCDNIEIADCLIFDTGGEGIDIYSSDFISITNVEMHNIGDIGFHAVSCTNGTFTNSIIEDSTSQGLDLNTAPNWTIMDNQISMTGGGGIEFFNGVNLIVVRNTLDMVQNGIWIDSADNATVTDNHVSETPNGYAIYAAASISPEILRNTVDDSRIAIYVTSGSNASIVDNTLTQSIEQGIMIQSNNYAIIRHNTIVGGLMGGVVVSGSLDCEITENTFEECGILLGGGVSLIYYIHEVEQNTVNGLPIFYEPGVSGQTIDADDYAQVLLVNNTEMVVHDGSFGVVSVAVEVAFSYECEFHNLDTSGNYIGIVFLNSENDTARDIIHDGYGPLLSVGLYTYFSHNISIHNAEVRNCRGPYMAGAFLALMSSDIIVNGSLFENNKNGLWIQSTSNVLISNNQILDSDDAGVIIQSGGDYFRVLNNEILNASYGVFGISANNWTIEENTMMYCSASGIHLLGVSYANISQNSLENNYYGVYTDSTSEMFIANNTIRWNFAYGVYLDAPSNIEVMYNVFAVNLLGNGYDDRSGNFWDDGVDTGNWWHDYSPPPPYEVDGNTDDRYPMEYLPTEPIISQPQDIYYAEGSTGNEITWLALDDSLSNWEVEVDGGLWEADAWNFAEITVNVDGLAYGTHTVIVTLFDIHSNSVTDEVLVHVYDGTNPIIGNTPNTEAFVTGSGQTLTWTVSDLHPDSYVLLVDGEEFSTGTWTNGELTVSIDGLTEGLRHLRMIISDIDGNTASDPVDVLVILDEIDPTISSPDDITYLVGATGNSIIWQASDEYPDWYQIDYNNSLLIEGAWGGSRIVLNVDGLSPGTHRFEITVMDGSGNAVNDAVNVIVLPIIPETTTPPPADLSVLLLAAAVGGMAVVGVVIIYIFYQKRK